MAHNLGPLIQSSPLSSGLLGKKPTALEVYEEGLVFHYKQGEQVYPLGEISAISVFDYFAPNPRAYTIDIFGKENKKIAGIEIPFLRYSEVVALMETHMRWQLGADFPRNLMELSLPLDDSLRWQQGTLIHEGRKGTTKYSYQQVDKFVEHKGTYSFTFKGSKDTLMVSPTFCPNCLTALVLGQAIAALEW